MRSRLVPVLRKLPLASALPYGLANAIAGYAYSSINVPTAPVITSEQTVTPANLGSHIVAGRRVILTSGSYGLRTFSANDQEVILQPGADISYLDVTGLRIKVRGEQPRQGLISGAIMIQGTAADICLDGITVNAAGTSDDMQVYGDRVAVINSDFTMYRYCVYASEMVDLVLGNNRFYSNGNTTPTIRIISCNRTTTVDSRIDNIGASAIYRVHADTLDSDGHYCARNLLVDGFMQIVASGDGGDIHERLIGVTIDDNDWYGDGSFISVDTDDERPEVLRVRNNRGYGLLAWPTEELPAWEVSGNSNAAYQAPPAWNFRP
jgi:hypothetical protein